MLKMKASSKEVYVADERIPHIGRPEIDFLKGNIQNTEKGRVRLCSHKVNEDRLHEMFIGFVGSTYLRPSRHIGKDESLHVLEGSGDYVFFDNEGKVAEVVCLGEYSSGYQFYCRIPESTDHALFIRSNEMMIHETTSGPFSRSDTVFAAWAPDESDKEAAQQYNSRYKALPRKQQNLLQMSKVNSEVYQATQPVVSIGRKEMDFLKSKVHESERKRVRLCAHKDSEAGLHEMFVVYMDQTYVKPNKHLGKDESLHILEGEADFYFFDESGTITDIIRLGDYNSGHQFYIRVPQMIYHTIIMRSERLVIHEATPGPFIRSDTIFASWAPEESNRAAAADFMNHLKTAAQKLHSCGKNHLQVNM